MHRNNEEFEIELKKAMKGFNEQIERVARGIVYKGVLSNNQASQ